MEAVNGVLAQVDEQLVQLVKIYDAKVYAPLAAHHAPLIGKIPRVIAGRELFTANNVTLLRTLLVLPILALLNTDRVYLAAFLVVLHDYLDHVDGIVAKVQRERGFNDDPVLGSFLDAFCDKIVINVSLIGVLMRSHLCAMPALLLVLFLAVVLGLMAAEIYLGIIRIDDYYMVTVGKEHREIQASMEGKLKEKLESLGLAFLCLATTCTSGPLGCLSGWLGWVAFLLSLRFASASTRRKLDARTAAPAAAAAAPTTSGKKEK